jgi:hypothetical protein
MEEKKSEIFSLPFLNHRVKTDLSRASAAGAEKLSNQTKL